MMLYTPQILSSTLSTGILGCASFSYTVIYHSKHRYPIHIYINLAAHELRHKSTNGPLYRPQDYVHVDLSLVYQPSHVSHIKAARCSIKVDSDPIRNSLIGPEC